MYGQGNFLYICACYYLFPVDKVKAMTNCVQIRNFKFDRLIENELEIRNFIPGKKENACL